MHADMRVHASAPHPQNKSGCNRLLSRREARTKEVHTDPPRHHENRVWHPGARCRVGAPSQARRQSHSLLWKSLGSTREPLGCSGHSESNRQPARAAALKQTGEHFDALPVMLQVE